jgi:ADP-ribosylglycohydrolase
MIGSIIGDIAGSCYEFSGNKDITVPLFPPGSNFTDDTVMLVATADALLKHTAFGQTYRAWGARYPYPKGGYGARFGAWLHALDPKPYDSWGNGSAMRVAPIGWVCESLAETVALARESAAVTHNHPEGIKGAGATAAAIWLARNGSTKEGIRSSIESTFGYNLQRTCDSIRPHYRFNESAQGTVPEAMIAFLDSTDFEHAIRLAISLGGDADTLACIAGGIAQAYYREIPPSMTQQVRTSLDPALLGIMDEFNQRYKLEPS